MLNLHYPLQVTPHFMRCLREAFKLDDKAPFCCGKCGDEVPTIEEHAVHLIAYFGMSKEGIARLKPKVSNCLVGDVTYYHCIPESCKNITMIKIYSIRNSQDYTALIK